MKNIHVLATNKPSRLRYYNNFKYILYKGYLRWADSKNIYITSDEEIKEGDWVYRFNSKDVFKADSFLIHLIERGSTEICKKIILTTNQDLINDGVQAIDDKFLEWFVHNPSCEKADIKKSYLSNKGEWKDVLLPSEWEVDTKINYKIIIPKEESKYPIGGYAPGYYGCTCVTCKTEFMGDKRAVQCEPCAIKMTKEEPKQETLEEAAENYSLELLEAKTIQHHEKTWIESMFIHIAKWQAERMYSEEDLREAFTQGMENMDYCEMYGWSSKLTEQQWFEQYKKK